MEMAEGNRHNCNASKYTESKNIGKMFKENKNSLEFHAGLFLVLYFKGKPDFIMISWNISEIISDKIWWKRVK